MADRYSGPSIVERLRAEGAEVITDMGRYGDPGDPEKVISEAGQVDILVANLIARWKPTAAADTTDNQWSAMFDRLVHPLMRFVRAVLPQMIDRQAGKIIAITSAAPLRPTPKSSAYSTARGAQNAYVRSVGAEVARHNVQFNAIAQAYVENVDAYQRETWETEAIQRQLRHVPARRIAENWEQAELVSFLASGSSDFICGQVMPFSGGWTTST
jgi:2-keto-3-deoxy-L-fuconate dehydrogenase